MKDPLLMNIIPVLPHNLEGIMTVVCAMLGSVLLIYAVFLEQEHRRDLAILVGAVCLMIYALFIKDTFFVVAMGGLALASLVEFIEIAFGLHKHSPSDLKKYKEQWKLSMVKPNKKLKKKK